MMLIFMGIELSAGMVAGMVKSGYQMYMSWTQVISLLKPGHLIFFICHLLTSIHWYKILYN